MPSLRQLANAIRFLSLDMVEKAKSGHPGMPMGMADVITVLYHDFIQFIPNDPKWEARDRLILSAGHGSALLYSVLYLTGYDDMTIEDLKSFRQLGAKTAGHPEYGHAYGIETTTGPLGQGLANGVGMALAERINNKRYNTPSHKTYVVVGDGCLMEGISQEAISFAGHLRLNNLIVLFDDNGISIDGPTNLSTSDNHLMRFKASGWEVRSLDGHNYQEIHSALESAQISEYPVLLACKTQIGYGAPNKAGSADAHGSPLGQEEVKKTRELLEWEHEPFTIPDAILQYWRQLYKRNNQFYHNSKKNSLKENIIALEENIDFMAIKKDLCGAFKERSTRASSGDVLEYLTEIMPNLIGGSADLTTSNNTKTGTQTILSADNYNGKYIHYGIREHAMGGIMNGIALYGHFIPYGGTFLVFSDYMRPAIRLAAIMQQRVIYIMTHDSIGLGEDGPTHQPIEHLASLRAIPGLRVFRPCDTTETIEVWELALQYQGPSVLALSRQNLPQLRSCTFTENMSRYGAYIIHINNSHSDSTEFYDVTIFATGSEVHLAKEVSELLKYLKIRIVSVVEMALFSQQSEEYKKSILEGCGLKVVIEAGVLNGWSDVFGKIDLRFGMKSFGASAPAAELFKHFGFDANLIAEKIARAIKYH